MSPMQWTVTVYARSHMLSSVGLQFSQGLQLCVATLLTFCLVLLTIASRRNENLSVQQKLELIREVEPSMWAIV